LSWSNVYYDGTALRNNRVYYFSTTFENATGSRWGRLTSGTYGIGYGSYGSYLYIYASGNGSYYYLFLRNQYTPYPSYSVPMRFRTLVYVPQGGNQDIYLGIGYVSPSSTGFGYGASNFFGFQITGSYIYGRAGNAIGSSQCTVASLNTNVAPRLDAEYLPGNRVNFYYNGSLACYVTSNLPDGIVIGQYPVNVGVWAGESASKYIYLSVWEAWIG